MLNSEKHIFLIPFLFAVCINTFSKCCEGMRKEKKIAKYRIETCRKVLISTPVYQIGAGTFMT
jgi:hypothetical protein